MRLILITLGAALLVGSVSGGRIAGLTAVHLRWGWLALAGIVLQLVPITGTAGFGVLLASFAALIAFAVANLRAAGFWLILVGLACNLVVIAANGGMPVTREALVASGQLGTLQALRREGGAKHHLAGEGDVLLFLADVIPIGPPIRQVVSIGDVFVHAGAFWLVVRSMRRREAEVGPAADARTEGT
ncbi:MAG TPA: DUF5317 domain-containing protein [Actinomycetota bacterium]|nr:DUF5317 domain-containing protein [Actinomycetota bacterium]